MAGETVSVGPFTGGLSTQSDEGAVADNELVVCQNFEVETDGSLRSRAPFVNRGATTLSSGWRMLGYYTNVTTGVTYPIGSGSTGTYYLAGTTWTLMTSTQATAVAQFNSNLYLLAATGDPNNGGVWNGSTFTADSSMPKGLSIVSYKSRLWVSDATQVRYSATGDQIGTNFWTIGGTYGNVFKLGFGDGQRNVKLVLGYGNLLIFRSSSIWQFSYSSDPIYGSQALLVDRIGLDSSDALEMFENIVYFIYLGQAYTLNGANATRLNTQVPFYSSVRTNNYSPFSVSVVNRKVIFSFYDVLFVFNLRSRTWTTWTSPAYLGVGKFLVYSTAVSGDSTTYVTNSSYTLGSQPTLFFTDAYTSEAESTAYPCIVQTKTFDYATPDHFKRLFWWGADMVARAPVTGTLRPVVASAQSTWGGVRALTWGTVLTRTWSSPTTPNYDVPTTATALTGSSRTFFRFPRSIRFRRIRYRISLNSTGASTTAPNKLFGIETVVAVKALVARQVS